MLYGILNNLYVNGDISIFCSIVEYIKQFDIKLLFIFIESIIYVIAIIVDNTLYIFLLVLLIIGLFIVSAGENKHIPIIDIVPIIIFVIKFSFVHIESSGNPMNDSVDVIRHIHDFDACIPNDGALIIEYIIRNIKNSLNIPSIIHSILIIVIFVIVRYIPSSPYLISSNFVSSYCMLFFIMFIHLSNTNFFILLPLEVSIVKIFVEFCLLTSYIR